MEMTEAMASFAALSQETRLAALRLLVEHGRAGLAAGSLAERLGVPANTLSFHLAQLERAGIVGSSKSGRQVIYAARIERVEALARFLLEDCCSKDSIGCPCRAPSPGECP